MNNHLGKTGLSLSQAQSISNLCYQKATQITADLTGVNNSTKKFKLNGETYTQQVGKKLPDNVKALLEEKAKLHATQAFLMSNIKAKEVLIMNIRKDSYNSVLEAPKKPMYKEVERLPSVPEDWGWDQLTSAELAEFLEAEAFAAHIGQFIHKDGPLERLRHTLPSAGEIGWIEVKQGEKLPVTSEVHHTADSLLKHHELLAGEHRKYEQRVNYFKAKVKNLVTEENARRAKENAVNTGNIEKENAELRLQYKQAEEKYLAEAQKERDEFESKRQERIKEAAALRITIDPRFQPTIDQFMKGLTAE